MEKIEFCLRHNSLLVARKTRRRAVELARGRNFTWSVMLEH